MKTKSGVQRGFMFYLIVALAAVPAWAADAPVATAPLEGEAHGQSLRACLFSA